MLRMTLVFVVWMASTAYALEDSKINQEAELHEAYAVAWNGADDDRRKLLDRAQAAWNVYRAANCEILGDECYTLMAQERAAELRHIGRSVEEGCGLTDTNVRTILRAHVRADDQR